MNTTGASEDGADEAPVPPLGSPASPVLADPAPSPSAPLGAAPTLPAWTILHLPYEAAALPTVPRTCFEETSSGSSFRDVVSGRNLSSLTNALRLMSLEVSQLALISEGGAGVADEDEDEDEDGAGGEEEGSEPAPEEEEMGTGVSKIDVRKRNASVSCAAGRRERDRRSDG